MVERAVGATPCGAHRIAANKCAKPCLRDGGEVAGLKASRHLDFVSTVEAYGEAGLSPWPEDINFAGRRSASQRHGTEQADLKPPAQFCEPRHHLLSQHLAWRNAKELSELEYINQPCSYGYPVLWDREGAVIGAPHPDDNTDLIDDPRMPRRITHAKARRYFKHSARGYEHFGNVPPHLDGSILRESFAPSVAITPPKVRSDASCVETDGPKREAACATRRRPEWYNELLESVMAGKLDPMPTAVPTVTTPTSAPASLSDVPISHIVEWLVDTGCGYDLVDKSDVEALAAGIKKAARSITFDTAGGAVPADKTLELFVKEINASIDAFVLDSTPNVLSVGKRCETEGWGFYWPPWSRSPFFVTPDGQRIVLETDGHIPYLRPKVPACCAPPSAHTVGAISDGASTALVATEGGALQAAGFRVSADEPSFYKRCSQRDDGDHRPRKAARTGTVPAAAPGPTSGSTTAHEEQQQSDGEELQEVEWDDRGITCGPS